ncbi:MAG: hypothetical protein GY820_20545 [Gammaproteobacteria bacterium]|nr:hypothetical protein [Gammaproteobacteria bacterium]
MDGAVGMELDMELEIKDVAIVGDGVEEEEAERRLEVEEQAQGTSE